MVLINKKIAPYLSGAIFLLLLDRFFKILALFFLKNDVLLLGNWLKFSFSKNYYIAFSLPIGGNALIAIIILIMLLLGREYIKQIKNSNFPLAGLILIILFGAASNLWDRLSFGYVIDYLDLEYFTVFNIADCMISAGAIILIMVSCQKGKKS